MKSTEIIGHFFWLIGVACFVLECRATDPKDSASSKETYSEIFKVDPAPAVLSAELVEQIYVIVDRLLPAPEKFDMKDAPPNGEVYNTDGSHYTFSPMIYVPAYANSDLPPELIGRLAKDHPRVMTRADVKKLRKEHDYWYAFQGRSYLEKWVHIQRIRPKGETMAEAFVDLGCVGDEAIIKVVLDHSSGKWAVKEIKKLMIFD